MIKLLEKNLNKKATLKPLPPQLVDMEITYADIGKAEKMLGYKPEVDTEEEVRVFVNWYQDQKRNIVGS